MPGDFTPFSSTLRSKLAGVSSTAAAPFAPMTATTASAALKPSSNPAAVLAQHAHGGVNVELKREGERIVQIRIQCRCGDLIELDCEY